MSEEVDLGWLKFVRARTLNLFMFMGSQQTTEKSCGQIIRQKFKYVIKGHMPLIN